MTADVSDLGDTIGSALGRIAREAMHAVSQDGRRNGGGNGGALSGMRGVIAGAALAAAAPSVARSAGNAVKNAVGRKVERAGGVPNALKEVGKQMVPGGGGRDNKGTAGVGQGRRMPVQQAVDIAVPVTTAYNQWTQFEEWPQFMHRLTQVTQDDPCTVSCKVKVWGLSREFAAQIVEQRPDERIQWNVTEGVTHAGVVTFHELAPRLTRVQVTLDVEPGSWLEKAARGMRHVKRAVRADLARFKAFVEMQEAETGAWRGTIHEGKLVREAASASSQGESRRASGRRSASARGRSGHDGRAGARASSGRSGGSRRRARARPRR